MFQDMVGFQSNIILKFNTILFTQLPNMRDNEIGPRARTMSISFLLRVIVSKNCNMDVKDKTKRRIGS